MADSELDIAATQQLDNNHDREAEEDAASVAEDPLVDRLREGVDAISGQFESLYAVLSEFRDFNAQIKQETMEMEEMLQHEQAALDTTADTIIQNARELAESVMAQWFEEDK